MLLNFICYRIVQVVLRSGLALLWAVCAITPSLRGETISLDAAADGTLYESETNAESSGIGPTLFVGRIAQSGGMLRRGLVQFDLQESLPDNVSLESVELRMRLSRKAPGLEDTTLTLHRVLQGWGEGSSNGGSLGGLGVAATDGDVTWTKSQFPSVNWDQPGGSFIAEPSASVTINEMGNFVWQSTPGLLDDVNHWLAHPELNHGWIIRGDEAHLGTAVRLDAREHATAAARPSLLLTYSVPEPSTLVLVAIGCLVFGIRSMSRRGRLPITLLLAGLSLSARHAPAQDFLPPIPKGPHTIRLEPVADGLNLEIAGAQQYAPTDMVFSNDGSGRMFAMTLGGVIRVGTPEAGMFPTPFLNTNNANTYFQPDSFGLTSIVFHPGFANPASAGYKKFYTVETEYRNAGTPDFPLSVTERMHHQSALYEYTCDDPFANVFQGTKRQVLRVTEPGEIHNTNEMVFGPDGYMYIAMGDGCNAPDSTGVVCSDNAQMLDRTYGKVLRIDPVAPAATPGSADAISQNGNYRVPADNPFVDTPSALGEIYAYGFRNPYRLSFDSETGRLYTGDVGQRNIESVDEVIKGGNYGWNDMEGTFLYSKDSQNALVPDQDLDGDGVGDHAAANGYHEPLLQYDHQDGKSVTGGFVYRGDIFPELTGKYLFGDFRGPSNLFQGRLLLGDLEAGEIEELGVSWLGESLPNLIYSFSEDANGEIYVLGGAKDGSSGVIYRLVRENPYGDTNGDGVVDLVDLNNVRNNFGGTGPGDANLDGIVDLVDLNAVRNNFGASNSHAVPEPSTMLLLLLGGIGLFARRSKWAPVA